MKVCLLGSAPSSVALAPYRDKSYSTYLGGRPEPKYPASPFIDEHWQIWGCSPGAYGFAQRADRWFEVHRWEPGQSWFSPEYVQFLQNFRGPVYTGRPVPEIKNHVVYPLEMVEQTFSSFFLTSSLALMAALAILEIENVREARRQAKAQGRPFNEELGNSDDDDVIAFFGVDMAANEEYGYQRPGCHFFILEALRRGIGVYVPPESDLLRPMPVYGICEWDDQYIKLTARAREFNARITQHQQDVQNAQANLMATRGAADDLDYMVKTWVSPFGMPAGIVLRHTKGTGLGGGTRIDESVSEEAPRPGGITYIDGSLHEHAQKLERDNAARLAKSNGAAHPE